MEFLEVPLYDDDIFKLLVRLGIDLMFLAFIVIFAMSPNQREREFTFTAVMLNVIVFFICFTMKKLELDLGLALGLFAVFGVLRYRTDAIRPKEMTYLFIVIGIGVINSLSNKKTSYAEILLVNSLILAAAVIKEWAVSRMVSKTSDKNDVVGNGSDSEGGNPETGSVVLNGKNGGKKATKLTVEYDRLQCLGPEHRASLLEDLRHRTGLNISKVEIKSVNLIDNKATLAIWTNALPEGASPPT